MAENRFAKAARARAKSMTAARRKAIARMGWEARKASRGSLRRWGLQGAKARWGTGEDDAA